MTLDAGAIGSDRLPAGFRFEGFCRPEFNQVFALNSQKTVNQLPSYWDANARHFLYCGQDGHWALSPLIDDDEDVLEAVQKGGSRGVAVHYKNGSWSELSALFGGMPQWSATSIRCWRLTQSEVDEMLKQPKISVDVETGVAEVLQQQKILVDVETGTATTMAKPLLCPLGPTSSGRRSTNNGEPPPGARSAFGAVASDASVESVICVGKAETPQANPAPCASGSVASGGFPMPLPRTSPISIDSCVAGTSETSARELWNAHPDVLEARCISTSRGVRLVVRMNGPQPAQAAEAFKRMIVPDNWLGPARPTDSREFKQPLG